MNILRRGYPHLFSPAGMTLLASIILVGYLIYGAGGDPLAIARIGTKYSQGDAQGSEGYDGQFVYYIARDPDPKSVIELLDTPAYRYQRILLPLLARLFSFGQFRWIGWSLVVIVVLSHALGTLAVEKLLKELGVNRWYALPYGLWVGFLLAVRLDLPEPLAYGLVAWALWAGQRGKNWLSWGLFGLSIFAKEVAAIYVAAVLLEMMVRKDIHSIVKLSLVSVVPYMIFQMWLWIVFGSPGIGSGGAAATSFEIIPFGGFFRIAQYSLPYFIAMLVVFAPAILLPGMWAIYKTVKQLHKDHSVISLSLLLNALVLAFVPFSTYRETGGLLRISCGLVLALILYSARYHKLRILNYSFFWAVYNVFLFKA